MRRVLGPVVWVVQYARLRSSVSHSGTSRGPVRRFRRAIPSTFAITPVSSVLRVVPRGSRLAALLVELKNESRWSRSAVVIWPAAASR